MPDAPPADALLAGALLAGALPVATTECCTAAGPSLLASDLASGLAERFRALADPTRVRLLAHIAAAPDATACACHLPAELGISQPTLSHHLKKLAAAGLVTREQRGRWAHYTVDPAGIAPLRDFLALA